MNNSIKLIQSLIIALIIVVGIVAGAAVHTYAQSSDLGEGDDP